MADVLYSQLAWDVQTFLELEGQGDEIEMTWRLNVGNQKFGTALYELGLGLVLVHAYLALCMRFFSS